MQEFVKKKHEVGEPEAKATYAHSGTVYTSFSLKDSNIFLIGPRGSGKSTLGRALASRLKAQFADTDEAVKQKSGQSIQDLVQEAGWEGFRKMEQEVLKKICTERGQVVATGGGIVLLEENRNLLKETGKVFYLMTDPRVLLARLEAGGEEQPDRPSLSSLSLEEEIAKTISEREPLYFFCLDYILNGAKGVEELVEDILDSLKLKQNG